MNKSLSPIFPAYTFRASPTYFAWVKLTAADVQKLRSERGFEGQNLYFYHNHPIRFVSITAPVVQIEDLFGKYALLALDDGSGANATVKITRLPAEITNSIDCPSNTEVDNLNIISSLGRFDISVDDTVLDIGTVVKVKCTISEFRGTKQLDLKRVHVVKSTSEEVKAWEDVVKWKRDVLSKPWVLTPKELNDLETSERALRRMKRLEERAEEEHQRVRVVKKAKRKEKMRLHEEKVEKRRRQEEVIMNAGALL
ncbi:hypothetical protein EJ08DRAFT_637864 [Tothia fuscella]|uniref:CST complex subunit Stn1 N-terminal domain-containing protein n=1 Tax=Tothia fuscella TaxID=1048955 RepID=A0A9P4TWH0_9PEZI|nr:hypothetical protein EJ08DRAFT_637864 [Tothia fuscella]